MVQSFACLLRVFKVTALIQMVLVKPSAFNESFHEFSFRLLSSLLMRFCRIASFLPHSTQNQTKFCGIYHLFPPVQIMFVLVLVSFLDHFVCFVVHALSHSWSMAGSMGKKDSF